MRDDTAGYGYDYDCDDDVDFKRLHILCQPKQTTNG